MKPKTYRKTKPRQERIADNLREFACLTTVILAPLRMEGGLHAGSATSLPLAPLAPVARIRSMVLVVYLAPRGPFLRQIEVFG